MPAWPSTLPQYVLNRNYSETPPNTVLRTQMDAGPAKVRQRFTAGVRQVSCKLILTEHDVETLDEFFVTSCNGSATAFQWALQRRTSDSDPDSSENVFPTMTFRFVKPPQYADSGDGYHYEVTLALEILP